MTADMVKPAVVIGIWGRAGGDGIPGLITELSPRLTALGVPASNIFSISWNPDHNNSPFETPDTDRHLAEVIARTARSYVAIIGHSYGGWAACRLSRRLQPAPDLVALIDPVFGPNGDGEQIVQPYGDKIHNWYQRNSITEPTVLEDCLGTVVGCPGGVSCGRSIPGINNHEVKLRHDWDGKELKRDCVGGSKPRHSFHLNIDSDRHVWRQIIEMIETDIKALKDVPIIIEDPPPLPPPSGGHSVDVASTLIPILSVMMG